MYFSSWTQTCTRDETQVSDGVQWVTGTYTWTLHDYYGEPGGWPHISSSYGQYDLAGFAKAPVFWYRSWWLGAIASTDAGRPPVYSAGSTTVAHIVERWAPPASGTTRTIHVYSNAPRVDLLVKSIQVSTQAVPALGWATFSGVQYAAGTLTARALAANGTTLATHTRTTGGAPASLHLTIDVPSPVTGTGAALYLDGSDVALLRVTVLDAAGVPVLGDTSAVNVTFAVVDGPGRIVGCGNGDPADQHPNHAVGSVTGRRQRLEVGGPRSEVGETWGSIA